MGHNSKRRKKAKTKTRNKKPNSDQALALDYVRDWANRSSSPPPPLPPPNDDDFLPAKPKPSPCSSMVFDLHSHSNHSDGFLSPTVLVDRAHRNGVKVLALTDHDTMAGVPEAVAAARKYGMRIIPGVEISAMYSPRGVAGAGESVHILAYYGMCGPSKHEELESLLLSIRDGRFDRAKNILAKLRRLKVPIKWDSVMRIAGEGVAPGRVHIARAMVEAGHVDNIRLAFDKYLYDDGPAYATGSEPFAETVVQLIAHTGGVSALAHPWALNNPDAVIRALHAAGLNALEVYRSNGKVPGFSELAEKYGLIKLGGSDFHGKGEKNESDLGTVNLSITTLYDFLKMAQPVWCNAMRDILLSFAEEPSDANLQKMVKFGSISNLPMNTCVDVVNLCMQSWLTNDQMEDIDLGEIRAKLDGYTVNR